jgi:CRP-like cAMP-binding protein
VSVSIGPLIRKLEQFGDLSNSERQILENLPIDIHRVDADQDLGRHGLRSLHCLLLLNGMVCRYRVMQDGQRQIMSFHFPGDILDLSGLLLGKLDHRIGTLTPVEVAPIAHTTLRGWIEHHPGLGRRLWQDTLVDAAVFRECVVNVSRRPAYARIAHLICEMVARMRAVGLGQDQSPSLPITAAELADATGLSVVHVNRVLQEPRTKTLVESRGKILTVLDWGGLKHAAGFDPDYLHQRALPAAA